LRRGVVFEIDHDRVDIAPAPTFRRIVSLDDGMFGCVEMRCCMAHGRLITAAHVTAGSADAQVKPCTADPETILTAARTRRHPLDACNVPAHWRHPASPCLVDRDAGSRRRSVFRMQPHPGDRDRIQTSCRKRRPFGRSDRRHRIGMRSAGDGGRVTWHECSKRIGSINITEGDAFIPCSIHLRVAPECSRRPRGPKPSPGRGDLQGSWTMKSLLLGATMLVGVLVASANPSLAAGDGLDRDAAAQGNGRFAGMHRGARITSRYGVMRPRRHHRHHRH
jgi:hypothetical protein